MRRCQVKRDRHKARARVVVVLVLLSALAGCSLQPRRELWVLDSPEYHVQNGWRMLDRGQATLTGNRCKKAMEAFEKVLELNAAYVPEAKTELASLTERARVSR